MCSILIASYKAEGSDMREASYQLVSATSVLKVKPILNDNEIHSVLDELSNCASIFREQAPKSELSGFIQPLLFIFDKHWNSIQPLCIRDEKLNRDFSEIVKIIPLVLNLYGTEEEIDLTNCDLLHEKYSNLVERIKKSLESAKSNIICI